MPGEFFAEVPLEGSRWASFSWTSSRWIPPGAARSPRSWQLGPLMAVVTLQCASEPTECWLDTPAPTNLATRTATQSVDKGGEPSGQGCDKP